MFKLSELAKIRILELLKDEKLLCKKCKKKLKSGKKYCSDCQYDLMLERQRNYYKFK